MEAKELAVHISEGRVFQEEESESIKTLMWEEGTLLLTPFMVICKFYPPYFGRHLQDTTPLFIFIFFRSYHRVLHILSDEQNYQQKNSLSKKNEYKKIWVSLI